MTADGYPAAGHRKPLEIVALSPRISSECQSKSEKNLFLKSFKSIKRTTIRTHSRYSKERWS
jgi:hypothetical protein